MLIIKIINVQQDVLMVHLHLISLNNVYNNAQQYHKIHLHRIHQIFVWINVHYIHMEVHKIYIVLQIVGGLIIRMILHNYVYKHVQILILLKIKLHNV
jgi:hypothetical protein